MRRIAASFSLLSAFFVCLFLFGQSTGSVEGVVVDGKTGVPIAGASVYFGSDKGPNYETVTDTSGQFRVVGMANGDYGCHFEKSGYITKYSGTLDSGLKPVHIAGGQDPVKLSVSLLTYAKLRGRVLDPEGKPVVRAKVTLAPLDETTDDDGRFSFSQLSPGSYTLKAMPTRDSRVLTADGFKQVPGTPKRETPPGDERTELLPTWYPSASAADDAEPIVVRGGDDLFGIDIRLQVLPVYRVRGKVFNLQGEPVAFAAIASYSEADFVASASISSGKPGGGGLGYFTLSRSPATSPADAARDGIVRDGSFELASVPRGLRQIWATAGVDRQALDERVAQMEEAKKQGVPFVPKPPVAGTPVVRSTSTLSVIVDHDIDDLEIRAQPMFTMEATTSLANTPADQTPAAVRNAQVTIHAQGIQEIDRVGRSPKPTGNTFRFENIPPGEVRVTAAPGVAGGYYLASIALGGQDITWKPVNVQAGAPPIGVIYKPNAGTVTGTVESADAREVVLVPQDALDARDVQYGHLSPTGSGGAFEIDSVGPGSYYLFAADRFQPDRLANAIVARRIAAAAALVQVTEGATIAVKAPLIRLDE